MANESPRIGIQIDWESRRWQAAVAAMQGMCAMNDIENFTYFEHVEQAIQLADALIAEFRKTEAK